MGESILSEEDVLLMLDHLLKENSRFNWDTFYSDKDRSIPFFVNYPDENLVNYFKQGILYPGKVLDLGCGPGRNALYLADKGCFVDAVDSSEEAINWGTERAKDRNIPVNFIHRNIFQLKVDEGTYDIVYDSGCFHHIPPHRRMSYLHLLKKALKPNGYFGLTCFIPGGELGGAEISDYEVYRLWSLKGGLGFTEEQLRSIFNDFEVIEMRRMTDVADDTVFGVPDLMTALFRLKKSS
ncbi:class I SAM-dependent methyltransferase [Peribacillus deserti]|uniref:SAM-dependent methyltransferase n=1 Tax=Peribacillus deserti TaxID=673318 RepID=A0A2N5M3K7_9BACI|nr:class I SAM-dependent methyltransferase [Peribacillus deserti]PLT28863.1 SAM-dependent methyltransferase [Peribacillus deserti]